MLCKFTCVRPNGGQPKTAPIQVAFSSIMSFTKMDDKYFGKQCYRVSTVSCAFSILAEPSIEELFMSPEFLFIPSFYQEKQIAAPLGELFAMLKRVAPDMPQDVTELEETNTIWVRKSLIFGYLPAESPKEFLLCAQDTPFTPMPISYLPEVLSILEENHGKASDFTCLQ